MIKKTKNKRHERFIVLVEGYKLSYLNVLNFIMIDFANKTASSWLVITVIRCHSLNNVRSKISVRTQSLPIVKSIVLNGRFSILVVCSQCCTHSHVNNSIVSNRLIVGFFEKFAFFFFLSHTHMLCLINHRLLRQTLLICYFCM